MYGSRVSRRPIASAALLDQSPIGMVDTSSVACCLPIHSPATTICVDSVGAVGSVAGTFGPQEQQLLLYTPYVADADDYYVTTEHRKHQVR